MKQIETSNQITKSSPRNIFKSCGFWMKNNISLIILGLVFIVAAFIRIWATEISSGPDVTQFWAFAKVFQQHGLDFYRYADAQLDIFPMKGWGFFYPPVWLIISKISLFFAPNSHLQYLAGNLITEPGWRLAAKMPIIIADLAIGLILYWGIPGSKWKKVLFASLWLLHPSAWFESAVFGQFDSIAAAFLLTSVVLLMKGKDRLAFFFAGLAIMTKQHTLLAVGMMVIVCARTMNFKRLLTNCAITAGVVAGFSIPFIVTGNFVAYVRSIVFAGSPPGYQEPLCFSFSGPGATLTFLHDQLSWNTVTVMTFIFPLLIGAFIFIGILCYKRKVSPLQAALAGYLIFIALYFRINYQYLIVYIPLALLLAATTKYKLERLFGIIVAMLPAAWLWITNVPWWFNDNTKTGYDWIYGMFDRLGMPQRYLPDWVYMTFALAIMATAIAYIVLAFTKWTEKKDNILPS